ncbi:hypothetical protein C8J57DRAFT_1075363 [Mycena rebaudengoi]|nr:hypothetical protein C8J57DRAFT_1075363 [Mycena rebaudengoi]
MPEFQVPPEGATFRIIGNVSGRALYSRLTGDPVFGAVLASAGANKDQYWSLVKGMGSKEGLFLFKNSVSGNVLYSRATTPPYVWHVGGGGRYFDNWFKFLPGTGEHAGMVRLVAPSTDTVLVSRANTTEIANHPYAGYVVYDDQWFKFEYEKVEQVEMTPPHLITSTSSLLHLLPYHNT